MKAWHLLPIVLLFGCAGPRTGRVTVRPLPPRSGEDESVRFGEIVGRYFIGRTVDAGNGQVLHEAHPVYRIEAEARWNLQPGQTRPEPAEAMAALPTVCEREIPTGEETLAELNQQRLLTRELLEQTSKLQDGLRALSEGLAITRSVASDIHTLHLDLSNVVIRVESLESGRGVTADAGDP